MTTNPLFRWLNTGIVLLLVFGFGYLPPIADITEVGMKIVGIFSACFGVGPHSALYGLPCWEWPPFRSQDCLP